MQATARSAGIPPPKVSHEPIETSETVIPLSPSWR